MIDPLKTRSEGRCELCASTDRLSVFVVPPKEGLTPDECVCVCASCKEQLNHDEKINANP